MDAISLTLAVTVDLNQALNKDIGCRGDRGWSASGVGNFRFIIDAVIKCNMNVCSLDPHSLIHISL